MFIIWFILSMEFCTAVASSYWYAAGLKSCIYAIILRPLAPGTVTLRLRRSNASTKQLSVHWPLFCFPFFMNTCIISPTATRLPWIALYFSISVSLRFLSCKEAFVRNFGSFQTSTVYKYLFASSFTCNIPFPYKALEILIARWKLIAPIEVPSSWELDVFRRSNTLGIILRFDSGMFL